MAKIQLIFVILINFIMAGVAWGGVGEKVSINYEPKIYHGWPTVISTNNGKLFLAYSAREAHIDPFGKIELTFSADGGVNWESPKVVFDSLLDDRDAGLLVTKSGTLVISTFNSRAFENIYRSSLESCDIGKYSKILAESINSACKDPSQWEAAINSLGDQNKNHELGSYIFRSTDGGVSWSKPIKVPVNAPHGPITTKNNNIIFVGRPFMKSVENIEVWVSKDDAQSWKPLGIIPNREGDLAKNYHEPHAVQCSNGEMVAQIRNHNKSNFGEILQAKSEDGGLSWSKPQAIGAKGYPSHLLQVDSDKILMTYADRNNPYRIIAKFSNDCGRTWGQEIILSTQNNTEDFGYPSTARLKDGAFVTMWYSAEKKGAKAQLYQVRWKY